MGKRYTAKFKFQIVLELLSGGKTAAQVAKAYGTDLRFSVEGRPKTSHGEKYRRAKGSRGCFFGTDDLRNDGRPLLLCEGELDAALAWYEAAQCNLIVTTTSAKSPLIPADQVQKGTHITPMGADDHGKQELEAELLAKAVLVVADSVSQCVDYGECFYAVQERQIEESSILELGHVIKNPAIGRTSEDQITVADLTEVAIQDIQIAEMVDRALREIQKQAR